MRRSNIEGPRKSDQNDDYRWMTASGCFGKAPSTNLVTEPDSDGIIVWKSQVVLGENKAAVKIAEFWDAASSQLVLCRCCHAVGVIAALEDLL